jgi:excisionase family DNA binding protein
MHEAESDGPESPTACNRKGACKVDATKLEPLAHSPDRAAQRLGMSLRAVYTHIATGDLRSFKVGKRRLIPDTELQRFVKRKMAEAQR